MSPRRPTKTPTPAYDGDEPTLPSLVDEVPVRRAGPGPLDDGGHDGGGAPGDLVDQRISRVLARIQAECTRLSTQPEAATLEDEAALAVRLLALRRMHEQVLDEATASGLYPPMPPERIARASIVRPIEPIDDTEDEDDEDVCDLPTVVPGGRSGNTGPSVAEQRTVPSAPRVDVRDIPVHRDVSVPTRPRTGTADRLASEGPEEPQVGWGFLDFLRRRRGEP